MSERVLIPGGRDVRATLDRPDGGGGDAASDELVDARACVVACPPHPRHGGDRTDARLRAVSDALGERGVACLRIDYGQWDHGEGERRDAMAALDWARERFDVVGCFGYSFGAGVALRAAAAADPQPRAVSALAPPAEAADAIDDLEPEVQVLVGERDRTVDSAPVAERARDRGFAVEVLPADHFFAGQGDLVGETVAEFLAPRLAE